MAFWVSATKRYLSRDSAEAAAAEAAAAEAVAAEAAAAEAAAAPLPPAVTAAAAMAVAVAVAEQPNHATLRYPLPSSISEATALKKSRRP